MKIYRPHEITDFSVFPEIEKEWTPEELKEVYALARANFTAADLQRYTEIYDEEFLAEDVLAEMEAQQEELKRKKA